MAGLLDDEDLLGSGPRPRVQPELSQGLLPPHANRIDPNREEESFWRRAAGGLALTETGSANIVQNLFDNPYAETRTDRKGNVWIRDPESRTWYSYDNKDKSTVNDFTADISGEVAQFLPNVVTAPLPYAQGAVAGLSSLGRQGLAEAFGARDDISLGGRLGHAVMSAGMASATQGAVNMAAKGFDKLRPGNMVANHMRRAETTPYAAQGAALEKASGVAFTPGQRTGSKLMLTVEGMLRRNPWTSDTFAPVDAAQLQNALGHLNRSLDWAFMPGRVGSSRGGAAVRQTFDTVLSKALHHRRGVAHGDFGRVKALSQGKEIMWTENTVGTLDDLVREFDVPGGGDATAALVGKLKSVLKEFKGANGGPKAVAAQQFQRLLQVWGKASKGKGQVLKDIDGAQQRLVAGRVHNALLSDLEAAEGAVGGELATALRTARQNYAENSVAIDDLSKSVLGRIFKGGDIADDKVMAKVLNMSPDELGQTMGILKQVSPETALRAQRLFFDDALTKAGLPASAKAPKAMGPDGETELFSPRKFMTAIQKSPVWDTLDGAAQTATTSAFRAMERIANRAGTDRSPTAPLMQAWDMVKAGVRGSTGPFLVALGAKRLAKMLTSSQGQMALRQLTSTSPKVRARLAASGYLGELVMQADAGSEQVEHPFRSPLFHYADPSSAPDQTAGRPVDLLAEPGDAALGPVDLLE